MNRENQMPYNYRCSCGTEWYSECDVNYLLRHPLNLGAHHHDHIAETCHISLERVGWHDQHLLKRPDMKAIDFDLNDGPHRAPSGG